MTIHFGDSTSIASGGSLGKVLQVVQTASTGTTSEYIGVGNYGAGYLSRAITTASSSSKVLIHAILSCGDNASIGLAVFRNNTLISNASGNQGSNRGNRKSLSSMQNCGSDYQIASIPIHFLDHPNAAGTFTYTVKPFLRDNNASTLAINRTVADQNNAWDSTAASFINLTEL